MPLRSNPVAQWTEPPDSGAALPIVAGFFTEIEPGRFRPTTDRAAATHGLNLAAGVFHITPLGELDGTGAMYARRTAAPATVYFLREI